MWHSLRRSNIPPVTCGLNKVDTRIRKYRSFPSNLGSAGQRRSDPILDVEHHTRVLAPTMMHDHPEEGWA